MKIANSSTEQDLDHLGAFYSSQLSLATPSLPHDITERLRIARQQALSQRKPLLRHRLTATAQAQNSTLTAPADEGLNLWSILASALPLLALVVGLMTIQWVQQNNVTSELAALDEALLIDELPPDAYTDAGFAQFLKQSHLASAKND